jgi:hypothetical protein
MPKQEAGGFSLASMASVCKAAVTLAAVQAHHDRNKTLGKSLARSTSSDLRRVNAACIVARMAHLPSARKIIVCALKAFVPQSFELLINPFTLSLVQIGYQL